MRKKLLRVLKIMVAFPIWLFMNLIEPGSCTWKAWERR